MKKGFVLGHLLIRNFLASVLGAAKPGREPATCRQRSEDAVCPACPGCSSRRCLGRTRALGQGPAQHGVFGQRAGLMSPLATMYPSLPERELMLLKSPLQAAGSSVLEAGTKQPQFLISCVAGNIQSAGR